MTGPGHLAGGDQVTTSQGHSDAQSAQAADGREEEAQPLDHTGGLQRNSIRSESTRSGSRLAGDRSSACEDGVRSPGTRLRAQQSPARRLPSGMREAGGACTPGARSPVVDLPSLCGCRVQVRLGKGRVHCG